MVATVNAIMDVRELNRPALREPQSEPEAAGTRFVAHVPHLVRSRSESHCDENVTFLRMRIFRQSTKEHLPHTKKSVRQKTALKTQPSQKSNPTSKNQKP